MTENSTNKRVSGTGENSVFNASFNMDGVADHQPLVLIVDDDRELSTFMALVLQQKGLRVLTASSGAMALGVIAQYNPDLVILDVMMPGMTGHETLHQIKQRPQFSSLPIMMMTSCSEQEDIVDAMDKGALTYVIKPVSPDILISKVESILTHHKAAMDDNEACVLQILEDAYRYGS